MSFSITVSADSLEQLGALAVAAGRKLQASVGEAVADEAPAAPKAPRKRTAPEAAPAPVAAPATAPAPAAAPAGITKDQLVKKLVAVINAADASGQNGKQVCTDLCLKFGGKNASAIDPSRYAEVAEAADKALEGFAEDPTA